MSRSPAQTPRDAPAAWALWTHWRARALAWARAAWRQGRTTGARVWASWMALAASVADVPAGARWLAAGALAALAVAGMVGIALGTVGAPGALARVVLCLLASGLLSLALLAAAQWLLRRPRGQGLGARVGAPIALAALLVAANVLLLARLLFVSPHDLWLLLACCALALALAVPLAWALGSRLARALARIQQGMERLAQGEYVPLAAPAGVLGAPAVLGAPNVTGAPDDLAELARLVNLVARGLRDAVAGRELAEAQRRQAMAAIAHDLRTPLAAVQVLVDALADGVVRDPVAVDQHYATLRREVCHLVTLVEELFELTRIESGALVLARAPVQLVDLIAGARHALRERAARGGVRLWAEIEGAPHAVLGDADQLYRVLDGTLRNALRHTPSGGGVLVHLSALAVGDGRDAGARSVPYVLVQVLDTGTGIAAEALPHIFEPAYRGEAARTRAHPHASATDDERDEDEDCEAGLGLAIAARLIAAHGGRMWAESPLPAEARALVGALADPGGTANTEDGRHPDTRLGAPVMPTLPGTLVSFTLPVSG